MTALTSAIPVFIGINSYYYNLTLRLGYALLSFVLLFATFGRPESNKISIGGWFLLAFWAIYLVRFFHDTLVEGLVIRGNLFKLYAIALGNCLLPAFACLRAARYVEIPQAIKFIRWSLILSCLSVVVVLYKIHGTLNPAVLGRARFIVDLDGNSSYQALNPITIGFFGECLALFSLGLILFEKPTARRRKFDYFGLLLGLLTVVLGASRGPVVGTIVGILCILLLYSVYIRKTVVRLLKALIIALFVFFVSVFWVVPKFVNADITIIRRMYQLSETVTASNGPREFRSYQWESAIDMFLQNPILGDRYLERFANFYPHNIYLEVFMSTGLVGAFFFYGMMAVTFYYVAKIVRVKSEVIILFWPLFAIFMWMLTSGSIFEGVAFWTFISFWFGVNTRTKHTTFEA